MIVTSGPGLTNLVTPILDAQNDSTPLVVISGQVPLKAMGTLAFQECPATEITKPITKWSYCIQDINEIPRVIDLAFKIANDGKKGAVHIDVPKCIASEHYVAPDEVGFFPHLDEIEENKVFNVKNHNLMDHFATEDAADTINKSEKPVLYVGQGCNNYSELLRLLVEKTGIPVTTTLHAMGVFDETHPLALKMVGMHGSAYSNFLVQEADCIIALGSRFDDRTVGDPEKYAPNAVKNNGIIHINIDKSDIGKTIKPDLSLEADCGEFLKYILPKLHEKSRPEWHNRIKELKELHPFKYHPAENNKIKQQSVLIELNKQLKNRDICPYYHYWSW